MNLDLNFTHYSRNKEGGAWFFFLSTDINSEVFCGLNEISLINLY